MISFHKTLSYVDKETAPNKRSSWPHKSPAITTAALLQHTHRRPSRPHRVTQHTHTNTPHKFTTSQLKSRHQAPLASSHPLTITLLAAPSLLLFGRRALWRRPLTTLRRCRAPRRLRTRRRLRSRLAAGARLLGLCRCPRARAWRDGRRRRLLRRRCTAASRCRTSTGLSF